MDNIVYLMGESGNTTVKVGKTGNVPQRRAALQSGNPRPVVIHFTWTMKTPAEAETVEKSIHAAFAGRRLLGEWFDDADGDIFAHFEQHAEQYVPALPGRPLAAEKHADLVPMIPKHMKDKLRVLVRKHGWSFTAKQLQTKIGCSRAVARYIVQNKQDALK